MSFSPRSNLWERLKNAGLVQGDVPDDAASPWYVRVMLGIAGWIAALFFLGFIGGAFTFAMRSAGAAAVAAAICCTAAYAVFLFSRNGDLAAQFGLATGIAGQIMFAVAVAHLFHSGDCQSFFLFAGIEILLTLLIPNFMHRIFTTVGAVAAVSFGFAEIKLPGLGVPIAAIGCAVVWRKETALARKDGMWQAVGYGLALGVLQTVTTALVSGNLLVLLQKHFTAGWLQRHANDVGTALVSAVFVAVVADILRELEIEASSREGIAALGCAALLMAACFPAHALAPSLLLLVLGFAAGNRLLFGLGSLAMAVFLSYYYYQMKETLLFKSLILAETGALLLAVRLVVAKLFPAKEGRSDA